MAAVAELWLCGASAFLYRQRPRGHVPPPQLSSAQLSSVAAAFLSTPSSPPPHPPSTRSVLRRAFIADRFHRSDLPTAALPSVPTLLSLCPVPHIRHRPHQLSARLRSTDPAQHGAVRVIILTTAFHPPLPSLSPYGRHRSTRRCAGHHRPLPLAVHAAVRLSLPRFRLLTLTPSPNAQWILSLHSQFLLVHPLSEPPLLPEGHPPPPIPTRAAQVPAVPPPSHVLLLLSSSCIYQRLSSTQRRSSFLALSSPIASCGATGSLRLFISLP